MPQKVRKCAEASTRSNKSTSTLPKLDSSPFKKKNAPETNEQNSSMEKLPKVSTAAHPTHSEMPAQGPALAAEITTAPAPMLDILQVFGSFDEDLKSKFCESIITFFLVPETLAPLLRLIVKDGTEEEKAAKKVRENGNIVLIYEMYHEEFPIVDGRLTSVQIDEEYCLSYVMPSCSIHLSTLPVKERLEAEHIGDYTATVKEHPTGTCVGLEVGLGPYYVFSMQEEAQLLRDQEMMKETVKAMEGYVDKDAQPDALYKDDGRGFESCSCIYGNPCVDEYGCKDWSKRFAIAKENGWKGF